MLVTRKEIADMLGVKESEICNLHLNRRAGRPDSHDRWPIREFVEHHRSPKFLRTDVVKYARVILAAITESRARVARLAGMSPAEKRKRDKTRNVHD